MLMQGTWEEISAFGDKLAGRNVRLVVLSDEDDEDEDAEPTLSPDEWQKEREALRERLSDIWPAEVSAVDAVREQRR